MTGELDQRSSIEVVETEWDNVSTETIARPMLAWIRNANREFEGIETGVSH